MAVGGPLAAVAAGLGASRVAGGAGGRRFYREGPDNRGPSGGKGCPPLRKV